MARIRSIKPEILEDEKTAGLSDGAFRLFISMLVMSDDFGNLRADSRLLCNRVWWARGAAPDTDDLLRELADADLIMVYSVRNQIYCHIRSWAKHQRIDNAATSRIPKPCDGSPIFAANGGERPRLAAGSGEDKERIGTSGKPDIAPSGLDSVPEPELIRADPAQHLAEVSVAEINRIAGTKYKPDSAAIVKLCRALTRAKRTADQAIRVIQSKRAWLADDKMRQYFRPATLLAEKNFGNYLDDLEAKPRALLQLAASSANDDEPDFSYAVPVPA